MKPVSRDELLDLQSLEGQRDALRAEAMEAKRPRRVHVGDHLTFLFENRVTVRYQVHEMIRTERIVKEADVQHELDTYNELLGGPGELGATLLVEIEDEDERDRKLREWLDLPGRLYVELRDGTKVGPRHDERQVGEDRLSSVQFLAFDTKGETPVAIGCDLPACEGRTELTPEQRAALAADLQA